MNRTAFALAALLTIAVPAAHGTTYSFTGSDYLSATSPYTSGPGVHLTGTFTTAVPLPAFMPFTDVSGSVTTASFNDTLVTRTLANSVVCSFQIATDAGGNITKWRIELRETPFTTGSPQHSISTFGEPDASQGGDTVGTGTAGASACSPLVVIGATVNRRGSWTTSGGLPSTPVTYTYAGGPFSFAMSPYSLFGRLNGTFTTANPLPAFMPLTDITSWMSSMSFHDSLSSATLFDHYVCSFKVATDGTGAVTRWQILLRAAPIISFIPEHTIESNGFPGALEGTDLVGHGIAPPSSTPCAPMYPVYDAAASRFEGTWTNSMAPPAIAPATYAYTGDPFTSLTAPYSNGSRLTGTITTANPLPSPRALTDVSAALSDFSFSDGVQTRTLANSALCNFLVATDSAGRITEWQISLRQLPFTTGSPQQSVESTGNPSSPEGMDSVGTGPAGATACSPITLSAFASNATQGAWNQPALASPVSAPTLGGLALALFSVLLAAAALCVLGART